jgi:tRNA(fMet)-specific endonuclease VapC
MKPIALDTNAYVAFKRNEAEVLAVLRIAPEILLSATVVGELLAGFAFGSREANNRSELGEFIAALNVRVAPVTEATADNYALVYAALRKRGKPIPTNDLWIAASALEHGAALLTFDAHFAAFEGLRSGSTLAAFLP